MFVRKKKNRSGSTTIVVVNKRHGGFVEVKNFGTAKSDSDVSRLYSEAQHWLRTNGGQQSIDFEDLKGHELEETERFFDNIDSVLINGTQLLLNQVYDSIGFNRIQDEVLRHLVIARVSQPMSKLATVEYLKSYYDEDVDLNQIYRYMDRLYKSQKELVQNISVEHTRKILNGRIGLMFYDVSTLYFETAKTDALREPGFSKDGKTAESQVVLGLLVSEGGYPLSYSLYNGSQYEGYTMIPMIDDFKQRFNLGDDFIVVADSGLMSEDNVRLLRQAGYKYIIRCKNQKRGQGCEGLDTGTCQEGRSFLRAQARWRRETDSGLLREKGQEGCLKQKSRCCQATEGIQQRQADQESGEQAWLQQVS